MHAKQFLLLFNLLLWVPPLGGHSSRKPSSRKSCVVCSKVDSSETKFQTRILFAYINGQARELLSCIYCVTYQRPEAAMKKVKWGRWGNGLFRVLEWTSNRYYSWMCIYFLVGEVCADNVLQVTNYFFGK